MLKKCKVVMLSTNEKAKYKDLIINPKNNQLFQFEHQRCTEVAQHLYILSDDEIKEGDWFYDAELNVIEQLHSEELPMSCDKKIIASTDSSLMFKGVYPYNPNVDYNIPSIPQSFIDKYVSEYNKGNIIEEVMVEWLTSSDGHYDEKNIWHWKLLAPLVNPGNNTINIKGIKNSWTKDEVIDLCERAWQGALNKHNEPLTAPGFTMWIKTNL